MFWFVPWGPVKDSRPQYLLQTGYKCRSWTSFESSRAVCLTNDTERRLSGMNAHLYWNVIFSHVTVVIRKINLGKTLLKYGSLSHFDEFEAHKILIGAITILHVMRKASSQNKGSPLKRTCFFSPFPGLSSTVTTGNEPRHQSLRRKWLFSPPLCGVVNYTWHTMGTHTCTCTNAPPGHFVSALSHKP